MFFVFLCIVQCLYESKPSLMMTTDSNPILAVTSHFSLVTPPLTQKLYAFCAFKTKTFGHHCSSYIASSVQNFLPHEIRNIQPTTASKTALKACLFQICYWVGVNFQYFTCYNVKISIYLGGKKNQKKSAINHTGCLSDCFSKQNKQTQKSQTEFVCVYVHACMCVMLEVV